MGEAETEGWRPGSYAEEPVVKCLSVTLPCLSMSFLMMSS